MIVIVVPVIVALGLAWLLSALLARRLWGVIMVAAGKTEFEPAA